MRPKTKILLSAISLVLVFTLGIIGVFALTQLNIDARLRVKFVAQKNVYATVSAKSYKSSQEAPVESLRPLVIDGSEDDGYEGDLAFSNLIEVTQAETVDYVFEITNTTEVVTNPELVIEPVIEFADDFATWTIYYMADKDEGYKQLSNLDGTGDSYTYIELAKGESVRVRLSINSTNAEEDVVLDDSTMSFRLYTASTAPALYEEDAAIVTDSHLYYEVGETISLGKYPQTYVGDELNEILAEEWIKYVDGEETELIEGYGSYDVMDYPFYPYEYQGVEYACDEISGPFFYYVEPLEFIVVKVEDDVVTLFENKAIHSAWFVPTYNYYGDWIPDINTMAGSLRTRINTYAVQSGIAAFAIETTIENLDFEGNPDKETTDKMWVPLSTEIEELEAALGENLTHIILRDGFDVIYDEDVLYDCYYKVLDADGELAEYNVGYELETGLWIATRSLCRIHQLDYKGF